MKRIKDIKPEEFGGNSIEELGDEDAKRAFPIALQVLPLECVYRDGDRISLIVLNTIVERLRNFESVNAEDICGLCAFSIDCPNKTETEV